MRNYIKLSPKIALAAMIIFSIGCSVANDRKTYISTMDSPKTIRVVGNLSGDIYFEKQIPVGHSLMLDLDRAHELEIFGTSSAYPATSLTWAMYDDTGLGRCVDKGFIKLDGVLVTRQMEVRDPEFPAGFKSKFEKQTTQDKKSDQPGKSDMIDETPLVGGLLGDTSTEDKKKDQIKTEKKIIPKNTPPATPKQHTQNQSAQDHKKTAEKKIKNTALPSRKMWPVRQYYAAPSASQLLTVINAATGKVYFQKIIPPSKTQCLSITFYSSRRSHKTIVRDIQSPIAMNWRLFNRKQKGKGQVGNVKLDGQPVLVKIHTLK